MTFRHTLWVLSLSIAFHGAMAVEDRYSPGTVLSEPTSRYSDGSILMHNTDGTRPRISFKPISGAFEGTYTLIQVTEDGKEHPIMDITVQNNKITAVKTFSGKENDSISLAGDGIWRFERDKDLNNPKGTQIQPGKLAFKLRPEAAGAEDIKLNFGSFDYHPRQRFQLQPDEKGKLGMFMVIPPQVCTGGKDCYKLESLNINVGAKFIGIKYAPQDSGSSPSATAYFFNKEKHGFLKNQDLLTQTVTEIQGWGKLSNPLKSKYVSNDPSSVQFSKDLRTRKSFLTELSKNYLLKLLNESTMSEHRRSFLKLTEKELEQLAGSLISWFQSSSLTQSKQRMDFPQRILREDEKNTFFDWVLEGVRQAKESLKRI